jgi:predicted RNase H-related nuclease YkuK (DUF458 family)
MWYTASGNLIDFDIILSELKRHNNMGWDVFVGTDSFIIKQECVVATAVCLYNFGLKNGGKYFFKRLKIKKNIVPTLLQRITYEAKNSIDLAILLQENGIKNIELHLDISAKNKKNATSKFSDMLTGYVKGVGFNYAVKPNAWASATIADRHSKKY